MRMNKMDLRIDGLQQHNLRHERTAPGWKVNQELSGSVKSNRLGEPVLQIGNRVFSAANHALMQPGTRLTLKVLAMDPVPHLKILDANAQLQHAGDPVRLSLPSTVQQQSGAMNSLPSLVNLIQVLKGIYPNALTGDMLQLVRKLETTALLRQPPYHGDTIRQILQNSGLFFEARLAALAGGQGAAEFIGGDTKALLLQLLGGIQRLTQRRRQAAGDGESALSRANLVDTAPEDCLYLPAPVAQYLAHDDRGHGGQPGDDSIRSLFRHRLLELVQQLTERQLWSLAESVPGCQSWCFEIPVQAGNRSRQVPVTIRHHDTPEAAEDWSVSFSIDLPATGAVDIMLGLKGKQANIGVFTDAEAVRAAFAREEARMRTVFRQQGLTVTAFNTGRRN